MEVRSKGTARGAVGFIAIHKKRGSFPSLGATRVWAYLSEKEALQDALSLSRLMSYKSVFADLPYGGAKATIMVPKNKFPSREKLFLWYAEQLNNLEGKFITGSDVGVEERDVSLLSKRTPFVIGDNVPAAYYTALGVFQGIEIVLEKIYSPNNINGKTFAVQGLGKTGLELIKLLEEQAGKIIVSDIDPIKVNEVKRMFPNIDVVSPDEIYKQKVDIFSPCALSYSINSSTEHLLQCSAIVGTANNQMENTNIELKVHKKGILYGIDYIVNSGGLISVVDQYENGKHEDKRIRQKLLDAKNKLKNVFTKSRLNSISPGTAADMYVKSILNSNVVYNVPQNTLF